MTRDGYVAGDHAGVSVRRDRIAGGIFFFSPSLTAVIFFFPRVPFCGRTKKKRKKRKRERAPLWWWRWRWGRDAPDGGHRADASQQQYQRDCERSHHYHFPVEGLTTRLECVQATLSALLDGTHSHSRDKHFQTGATCTVVLQCSIHTHEVRPDLRLCTWYPM